jgi:4-amino-4-deoxy-L-arabinose transferase-like glycosyltransferase
MTGAINRRGVPRKLAAAVASLWLIVAVAAALRVGYAIEQVRITSAEALASAPFEQETGNIAMSLATGEGFSSPTRKNTGPTAWLTPVYPLIVAGIFRIFGVFTLHSFYAAAALNILFSTATCVPIYFAGRRIAGAAVASLAAWIWALFPNAIIIPFQWIWDTSLTALLAATILWATIELADSTRIRNWCAYGPLWGFTLLTNPTLAAALPFLLAWLWWRGRKLNADRAGSTKRAAAALALAVLCCIPWTTRNYARFHRFIPLRSNFPFELWLGNNYVFDEHAPINARVTRYGEERRYGQLGETAFMQEKWRLASEFIRAHKRLEVRLTWWRFLDFWLGSFRPVQDFENSDSAWIRVIFAVNFLTALGGAGGVLVLWARRNAVAFPVTVFVVALPVVYYVTHGSLRYRYPIDPILLLLTAVAAIGWGRRRKGADRET